MRKVEKSQVEKSPEDENSLDGIDSTTNKLPTVKVSWHAKKALDGIQNEATQAGKKKPKQWDVIDSWLAAYQSLPSGRYARSTNVDFSIHTPETVINADAKFSSTAPYAPPESLSATVSIPNPPVYVVTDGQAHKITGPVDVDALVHRIEERLAATFTKYMDDVTRSGRILSPSGPPLEAKELARLRKSQKEKSPEPK
jgi:hypothetical protein